MGENLLGEFDVAFRSSGADIVSENRFAVAGGLGEANAAGNHGFEDLAWEELPEILRDHASEVGAVIEHGEQDSLDAEVMTEGVADLVDGVHELGDPFESEELALDGDEHRVGGDQGIEGEQVEGGRAIDDDVVELSPNGLQDTAETGFAIVEVDEFDVGGDKVAIGGEEREALELGTADEVRGWCARNESVVECTGEGGLVNAYTSG
jgi:hypothetical protein